MKPILTRLPILLPVLLALPVAAEAQGPPEVPILPPTRQQAVQDTAIKRETLPPLALPDIVIFGRGNVTVREGTRLFGSEKRTVLDREIAAPVGEKGAVRTPGAGSRLLAAQERVRPATRGRTWVRGGTYGEGAAGVDYWGRSDRTTLLARAEFDRTDGHIEGSRAASGKGGVSAIHDLSPFTRIGVRTTYGTGSQHEWGTAAPAGAMREWYDGSYSLRIEGTARRGLDLYAEVGGRHTGLTDAVRAGSTMEPVSNGGWAQIEADWLAGSLLVSGKGRVEGDRLSGFSPGQTARLEGGDITVRTITGAATSMMLGVSAYHSETGLGPATRVWPLAAFTAQYSDRFTMRVSYEPSMDYLTMGEAREVNPFVANSFRVVPREERFHLSVGLDYTLTPDLTARFEVARRIFDRLPAWRLAPPADNSDGLFILDGLVDVSVDETRMSLEGRPAGSLDLTAEVVLRRPGGEGITEVPHLPRFESTVEGALPGPLRTRLEGRIRYLGVRYGERTGSSTSRIPAGTDLGLRASRDFGASVTVWIEARNLLGQDLVQWEGYMLPGRTSALGVSVRF